MKNHPTVELSGIVNVLLNAITSLGTGVTLEYRMNDQRSLEECIQSFSG